MYITIAANRHRETEPSPHINFSLHDPDKTVSHNLIAVLRNSKEDILSEVGLSYHKAYAIATHVLLKCCH